MPECGMLTRDRKALQRCSVVLCKQMVVDEVLIQSLQADDILTESMAESLMVSNISKRSFRLLLLLPKRGPKAFSSFCTALRDTEQQHLCDLLTQSTPTDLSEAHRESMEVSLDTDSPILTPVIPCSHEFYLSHIEQSYKMNSSPRGLALVISNVAFDPLAAPELDLRKGGEVDDEVLRKVFTELDYIVTVQRNLTAQDMRVCIESFSRRPEHRTVDSCVLCLLSHGVEGAVYGTDGQLLQVSAADKAVPKFRFKDMDCGVEQTDGPPRTCSPSCEQLDAGREGQSDANLRQRDDLGRPRIKLPQRSDMICGFASLKGTAAMRNTKRGSWFVQDLNTVLRLRAKDTHLADMLVQVNSRIKEREGHAPGTAHHRCKEMSEFTSSLCKDLYFFPKHESHF
uniref:Caspase 2, apoptosis-related cysteine peptidase n=1 Tax=Neogobius melanostomus TaxID=47308 RepID=A0A8C6SDL6_9GOBI